MRTLLIATLVAAACSVTWAGETDGPLKLEGVSVQRSPTDGFAASARECDEGGPGTDNPTRIEYRHMRVAMLLIKAYGMKYSDLNGPEWIFDDRYDIAANVPPGATDAQFRVMLQDFLAERFKLKVHYETQEGPVYSLRIATGGLKLREHVEPTIKESHEGYSGPPPIAQYTFANGRMRLKVDNQEIGWLQRALYGQLNAPVTDETHLTRRYDFDLCWSIRAVGDGNDANSGSDLITAVEEQLGLKVDKGTRPVEALVIDHVEKIPTGDTRFVTLVPQVRILQ